MHYFDDKYHENGPPVRKMSTMMLKQKNGRIEALFQFSYRFLSLISCQPSYFLLQRVQKETVSLPTQLTKEYQQPLVLSWLRSSKYSRNPWENDKTSKKKKMLFFLGRKLDAWKIYCMIFVEGVKMNPLRQQRPL